MTRFYLMLIFVLASCNGKNTSTKPTASVEDDANHLDAEVAKDAAAKKLNATEKERQKNARMAMTTAVTTEFKQQLEEKAANYSGLYPLFYRACLGLGEITQGQKIFIKKFVSTYVGDNSNCEEAVAKIPSIKILNLENSGLDDISLLEEFIHLDELYLANNWIVNLNPLKKIPRLLKLGLGRNQIQDISPLAGLTMLVGLGLNRNKLIEDITPLKGMVYLRVLGLRLNLVSNLAPLVGLKKLAYLTVAQNRVDDISVLGQIVELKQLNIAQNHINVLTPIIQLPLLNYLDLTDNGISSSDDLKKLKVTHERLFFAKNMFKEFPLDPSLRDDHLALEANRNITCNEYRAWGVDESDLFPFVECDLNK